MIIDDVVDRVKREYRKLPLLVLLREQNKLLTLIALKKAKTLEYKLFEAVREIVEEKLV